MNHPKSAAQEKEDENNRIEASIRRLGRLRPTLTEELPSPDIVGIKRISRSFWGSELLDMSLVFVAGVQRFANIIPDDLTPDIRLQLSLAKEYALYVMTVSSLYWAEEEKEVGEEAARLKARDIIWTFGIGDDNTQNAVFGHFAGEFDRTFKAYHHQYKWTDPEGYDGSDAIKATREKLKHFHLWIPPKLNNLIHNPRGLEETYRIVSDLGSAGFDYWKNPVEDYVRLLL